MVSQHDPNAKKYESSNDPYAHTADTAAPQNTEPPSVMGNTIKKQPFSAAC
jgi:hypothetical protein